MPVRQALNVVYAHVVRDMDAEQRKKFDDDLHGITELNARAMRVLTDFRGGEPPAEGSPAATT